MIDTDSPKGSWADALQKPNQRFVVELPYPPSGLMPNKSRTKHWRKNGDVAKTYKAECAKACLAAVGQVDWCPDRPILVELTYHRHDRVHADLDNLLAATKAGIDAISKYLKIDDKWFEYTIRRGGVRKPSIVRVVI